jgi:hypothetical protein
MALHAQARQLAQYGRVRAAILSNQCLDRRIPDRRSLERQVAAWLLDRNTYNVKANWRFTAADARIKLKSLYPAL